MLVSHHTYTTMRPGDISFHNQNVNLLLISKQMSAQTSYLVPQAATLRFAQPLCAKYFLSVRFPYFSCRVSEIIFQEFGNVDHRDRIMLKRRRQGPGEDATVQDGMYENRYCEYGVLCGYCCVVALSAQEAFAEDLDCRCCCVNMYKLRGYGSGVLPMVFS